MNEPLRAERDSIGEVIVFAAAYFHAQTQRDGLNFPISGLLRLAEGRMASLQN